MDIKVIINAILIIFVIHIILLNINFSYDIGTKKTTEKFGLYSDPPADTPSDDKTIDFLTNNSDSGDDFKKKLMKYIQEPEPVKENEFEKKNLYPVEPGNTYLSNNNEPNFESNVADIKKFYKVNFDNLNEDQLKATSIDSLNINIEPKECDLTPYVRKSTAEPDTWNYKNEIPMNGGQMNGIVGFDSLESQFAIYNPNKLNLQTVNENKFSNIPHDDLRKPIVYEN